MKTSWLRSTGVSALAWAIAVGSIVAPGGSASATDRAATAPLTRLDAVSCPTTTSCFAVGDSTVLTTSDSGAHWTPVATPPDAFDLTALACTSATRCLVVGSDQRDMGVIYRTVDGGATWRVLPAVVPGGFFLAISCPSTDVCVATGNGGAIFSTVDGGRTWTGQTLTKASLINAVDCITTTVCEAVGYSGRNGVQGVALRTTDGGLTWVVRVLPTALSFLVSVACPSLDACVAVGWGNDGTGSQVALAARTNDGGTTWRRRPVPSGYYTLSGVSCPDAGVCEAAGGGPKALLGTVDDATTWTPQGPGGAILHGIACRSVTTCVAVGETSHGRAAIYRTTDAGQVWQRQPIG